MLCYLLLKILIISSESSPVFRIGKPGKLYLLFDVVLIFYPLNPIVVIPARLHLVYLKVRVSRYAGESGNPGTANSNYVLFFE